MSKMTKEELRWVKRMNKLIAECPSDRIGFFTGGDPMISMYDCSIVTPEVTYEEHDDLVRILRKYDAFFDENLFFPRPVDGVCI